MTGGTDTLEILLRGIAIGALVATTWALVRNEANPSVRISGALLCVSIVAYILNSSPVIRPLAGSLRPLLLFLSWGGVGAFWLLVRTLFEDRRISLLELAPYAALTAFGLVAFLSSANVQPGFGIAHNIVEAAVVAHVLFVIYRSWRGDLVEARRRLRGPFMAGVALFIAAVSAFEIGEDIGIRGDWYPLAAALALAVLCLFGAGVMLKARPELFGAAAPALPEPVSDTTAADRAEIARLTALMKDKEAWRREGLAIGDLAADLRIPEHRLRRLINDYLGHRNFAAFVNSHRIEAAKAMLGDIEQARKTVASIAFDLGFGSLGPFNRAFKEATGQTPTEWRRQALTTRTPAGSRRSAKAT
jgi:AraC-like DNA-binding protein